MYGVHQTYFWWIFLLRRENVNSVGDKPITLPSVENHKSPMTISGMKK